MSTTLSTTYPAHLPVTLQTQADSAKLLSRFVCYRSANLLLSAVSWGSDPPKEITESMSVVLAALDAAKEAGIERKDSSISCLVVGDGRSPRTGALVALLTGWEVTSIDPALRQVGPHPMVRRLFGVCGKLESYPLWRADIVLAVHSHASVAATRAALKPGGVLVSMPCCVPWEPKPGAEVREAAGCLSPARWLVIERGES